MSDGVTLTKGEGRRRQTLPTLSFSLGHGATARQPGQSHFLLTPGQGLQKPQDIYEPLRAITIKGKKGQSQCPGGPGASSTWRLPLRGTALSPGELPALWHHHLLVQSQDRGRAGAVRTIKSESPPAPPATSGPVAGDKKPPQGQRYLGEPLASRPPDGVKRSNHTCPPGPCSREPQNGQSFPEPGSVSHTETLNSCRHTSSVCGDAAGKLSHSQPQAELEAYSIWRQKGRRPQATVGEGERGEGGGRREEERRPCDTQ